MFLLIYLFVLWDNSNVMKLFKSNKLLTFFIVAVNLLFIAALAFGEGQYINTSRVNEVNLNKESFNNTNVSLGSMTNNYLVGESHLCRSWANYLNSNHVTEDEAKVFLANSITDKATIMAHIVYRDDFSGVSTKASATGNDKVDYSGQLADVFASEDEIEENSGTVKASYSFKAPISYEMSIAFYTKIQVFKGSELKKAYLLRVVPLSNLQKKWTFPSSFAHLSVAILDNSSESKLGAYIYKDSIFTNDTFYEFYKPLNLPTKSELEDLQNKMTTSSGTMTMKINNAGDEYFVSYSQITDKWTIVTAIPTEDIEHVDTNWLTISIIGIGLGALFLIDLVVLLLLNKSLQSTAKEAESANKAKTEFLSTMSHDIRTPMNAIVGLTNIASRDQNNPELTQDALKKIALASNHLLTLINDILDISKVESGKLTMNPLPFSIVDSFENLVNISQPMVRSKNIDFSFRTHNFEHEWLYADKLRLNQIFTNLLSNALKYTNENGKVSVDIKELPSEKEGYVKLVYQVEDNGIGMSQEYQEKMFQPFTRATDSRVNHIQGTGLGLTITKQMVDLMDGTIECQSELGKGTTFVVTIDLPIEEKPVEEMVLPPMKVLIVDDDEILLKTAEDTLKSLGTSPLIATNGKQALEMIKDNKDNQFKVVILDWKMPDMDGLEVSKRIKEIGGTDIPIILISAYDWSEIEEEAKDAGIDGFIFKPMFRSKIYQKIIDLFNNDESKATPEQEEELFTGTNILVVEDNDINYEIVSTLLGMHGIVTQRAENGKIAYELIKEVGQDEPFDLIFMDIQMPVMNGLDATRAIRKLDLDYAKNVPIIAMTADAFSENVVECIQAGMNAHIAKPIDINLVLAEIKKNLNK